MAASNRLPALVLAVALALGAGIAVGGELIREQDSAGRVCVIREVAEDAAGNCVNHGVWQMFSPDGPLVAEGQYEMGRRTGAWRRVLAAHELPPAMGELLRGFEPPFLSEAQFVAGNMSGAWTIADVRGRKCASIALADGVREGELACWSPTGDLVRRETYRQGRLNGEAFALNDGRLVHSATWLDGFRLVRSVAYHDGATTQKRSEGNYLVGPQTTTAADDFWSTRLAEFRSGNECLPHGLWRQWHAQGQLAAEGRYAWGRPTGAFLWRHANGQKAVSGSYAIDGRPQGDWRWWNAEGAQAAARTIVPPRPAPEPPVQMVRQPQPALSTTVR